MMRKDRAAIRLVCHKYHSTEAMIGGLVRPDGIELSVVQATHSPSHGIFTGEFDAGEFSLAEFVYYASRDNCDFVGIPVFPLKMFRHGFLFCKRTPHTRISRPEELNGKRIGFPGWVQTASVWVRGMLTEEYDVSPSSTSWFTPSIHHWDDTVGIEQLQPRNGSVVRTLANDSQDPNEALFSAMGHRKLDAIAVAGPAGPFTRPDQGNGKIARLFRNPAEAEVSYFKKTGIFPIIHLVVARRSAVDRRPELPKKIFDLFVRSKRMGMERSGGSRVWKDFSVQEEREIFQGDPRAYGLQKNRRALEKFLQYCHEQGISGRRLEPEDLFAAGTQELEEGHF